jgi:hypothetical protein
MLFVLAKSLLTPLLLALCTIVSRRWGDVVGGWLLGLPLASGPVSLFLEQQHGAAFAATAAYSTLFGFVAVGAFCVTYLALAEKHSWRVSLAGSLAVCLGIAAALAQLRMPLVAALAVSVVGVATAAGMLGEAQIEATAPARALPSVRGTVARMAIAGGLVLAITAASGVLGGSVSGMIAPMPVLAALMAAAAHRRYGSGAVQGLLRGIVVGLWGGVAFFAVVAATVGALAPAVAYAAAAVAAALAGWTATRVARRRPLLRLQQHLEHASLGRPLHRRDPIGEPVALSDERRRIDLLALEQAQRRRERAAA